MTEESKKYLLKLDLQTFSEDPDDLDDPGETDPPEDKKPPTTMIPKSRFDDINTKFKETQAKLDKFLADQTAAEDEAKKKQGQFEELYNTAFNDSQTYKSQAEQFQNRTTELEGVLGQLLTTKLADIPEDLHDLIPETLTPEGKLAWIDRAYAKGIFKKAKDPGTPVGGTTNPPGRQTTDLNELNPFQLLKAGYGSKA